MTFKQKVYSHYQQLISDKIGLLQQTLADLKESGSNETKSTAGDKHETALAMLQIEQQQKRDQLSEALLQKTIFEKINPVIHTGAIINGSLIKTNRGWLFLGVALGKTIVDEIPVISLSPQSPLGSKLAGLRNGDTITVNSHHYIIENIE